MKILFKLRRFHGGSALSALEYVKVVNKLQHQVVVVGEYSQSQDDFSKLGVTTIDQAFFKRNPLENIILFISLLKIVLNEKPDLFIAVTQGECYYARLINSLFRIPVIYIIPGGEIQDFFTKIMRNEKNIIVFSDENKQQLLKSRFKEESIETITNRMTFDSDPNIYGCNYQLSSAEPVQLLLISRLDYDKKNSIFLVLNLIEKIVEHIDVNLTIIGDGELRSEVREFSEKINSKFTHPVIFIKGHVTNVKDYILNSHIVFGKGRSVVEPMFYSKVSFVISESGTMFWCRAENIEQLKSTNFTGRNLSNPTSYDELSQVILSIKQNHFESSYLTGISEYIGNHYDVKHAEARIGKIIHSIMSQPKSVNAFSLLSGIIKTLFQLLAINGRLFIQYLKKVNSVVIRQKQIE
ncbi:glycosyltransferase family 4 protein [Paenibacillus lycopersici]|uniref:Glycosyltransferase family 4 protein n=1 Tax=Paenibacillus lycopersici TaxID=2704462 RepID=A0A6C0FWS8_9BACL|nr:glycosyltransferase family 4 protein [Paenibacillus lycopersici]QHT59923.1 glycosyltransferase family 4 protein [Paenibacillus lycopersici]